MFVHGEAAKMEFLAKKVQKDMGLPCFTPANGETVNISCPPQIKVKIESDLARKIMKRSLNRAAFHAALVNDGKFRGSLPDRKVFRERTGAFTPGCCDEKAESQAASLPNEHHGESSRRKLYSRTNHCFLATLDQGKLKQKSDIKSSTTLDLY